MQMGFRGARGAMLGVLVLACLALTQLAQAGAVTISGTPAKAALAGRTYTFTPTARADAGKTVKFTIANKPAWASFDAKTGTLIGTPTEARVGTYTGVTISVTDGTTRAALPAFSIAVTPQSTNRKPTITGTPPKRVSAGQAYNFVPKATDPDGHALRFYIASKPSWASFDPLTGRLWGVPTHAQYGSYEEIKISVYDGGAAAALPLFSINVERAAPAMRNVTLSWNPPTRNSDGSSLTDLRGYKILYGTKSRTYTTTIKLTNAGLSRYVIENLPAGRYYFAMVAYNAEGEDSDPSAEVSADLT